VRVLPSPPRYCSCSPPLLLYCLGCLRLDLVVNIFDMTQRRPSTPSNSPSAHRKYTLRRFTGSRKRAFALVDHLHHSSPNSHALSASDPPLLNDRLRPVLVPLHPNLRRLPSRIFLSQKGAMRDAVQNVSVKAGTKRKRVVSSNENTHTGGRPTRGWGRCKRMRSSSHRRCQSDDDETSSMNIDTPSSYSLSDISDAEDDEEDDAEDSCLSTSHS
jgi:mitogen-activated protein kinase kinase kinase 13